MKKTEIFITVIIPVKQLTYHLIFENLPAFAEQTYKNFEVLVLPNEHSQYDLTLLKTYKWLKIIPTGKISRPAQKRDIGAQNANGEILAFIDDDAYPDKNWLKNSSLIFKSNKIAALCGPGVLPEHSDFWEKIFDQVVKTFIGSGGYGYRFSPEKKRYVDDYPSMNFLIKKKVFSKLGGFNSDYWPGEDSKLCEDLVYKEKGEILYHPSIVVYHHRRKSLRSYLTQHAGYGFHRGAFFAHGDKNSRRLSYLIPTFFVIYVGFSFLFAIFYLFFQPNFLLPTTFYFIPAIFYLFAMCYLFFLSLFNTKNILIGFGSVLTLFLTHVVYGILFVKGLIKGYFAKNRIYG